MAIDYSVLALPKGKPRIVSRIEYKAERAKQERACRKTVNARDQRRCRYPGCRTAAVHLHHVVYRSHGGAFDTQNIVSVCRLHHALIHARRLEVAGNADGHLRWADVP